MSPRNVRLIRDFGELIMLARLSAATGSGIASQLVLACLQEAASTADLDGPIRTGPDV
jgi:hypothetical protein